MRYALIIILIFFLSPVNMRAGAEDIDPLKSKRRGIIRNFLNMEKNPGGLDGLKKDILDITRESLTGGDKEGTVSFLQKLLRLRGDSPLHYFICLQLSKLDDRKEKFHITRALEFSPDDRSRLESLTKLYEFHKKKGDIAKEIIYLKKQAEIKRRMRDQSGLDEIHISLGEYYMRENHLLKSLQSFLEFLKHRGKITDKREGYVLNRIANIFKVLGRYRLADKYLMRSLNMALQFNQDDLRMKVYSDLASICLTEEKYEKAGEYIYLGEKIGIKNYFPELSLNLGYIKAQTFIRSGREIEGLSILKNAVDSGIRSESFQSLLPVLSEFIRRAVMYGNLEIASFYLERLDDIYAPYYPGYFFYYFLNARVHEQRGELELAERYYRQTSGNLEKYFSSLNDQRYYPFREEISEIYSVIARFNFRMFDLSNDVRFLKRALFAAEVKNPYMFKKIPGAQKASSNLDSERIKLEGEIQYSRKKIGTGRTTGKENEYHRKRIDELNGQLIELDDFLAEAQNLYTRYRESDLDIRRIQRSIDNDTTIIRYIMFEDNTYAFVIDRQSAGYKKLETGTREIKKMINDLTLPVESFAAGDTDFLRIKFDLEKSLRLYNVLLSDILEFHRDKVKLVIVPDREIYKIPFGALVTEINQTIDKDLIFSEYENSGFLIDNYSIEYLLSLLHWNHEKNRKKHITGISAFGSPVLTGGPNDISGDIYQTLNRPLEPIPSSGEEIRNIQKIWGNKNGKYFTGKAFTKENFNAYATRSGIVHIATHFITNRDHPWYSLFLFSPGEKNDPVYYVSDISGLDLNCDLVFLSTCESSENHLMGEQSIHGMTAALYQSGVGSMIASQWPVNEFSAGIIAPFYTELRSDPQAINDIAKTLRKVKRAFRKKKFKLNNGKMISMSHPVIWSNFVLYTFSSRK